MGEIGWSILFFYFFLPLIDQVIRALQGGWAGAACLVCIALNKDWIYSKSLLILLHFILPSPPSFLPHVNSPWLLPTPIKSYKHKNPQALKSCPGEVGWLGGGVTGQKHPPLYNPQSLHPENERKMEGRVYCL